MTQVVIGRLHNTAEGIVADLVYYGAVFDPDVGHGLLVCRLLSRSGGIRLLGFHGGQHVIPVCEFVRGGTAEAYSEGFALICLLVGVVYGDSELRVVKPVFGQLIVSNVVSYVIRKGQTAYILHIAVYLVLVQRRCLSGGIGVVNVVLQIGIALLVADYLVVFSPGEVHTCHIDKVGNTVVEHHVVKRGVIVIHGIVVDKIHVAVSEGDIALIVQSAVIAHVDRVFFSVCRYVYDAQRVVESVLAVVCHILYDKGSGQSAELGQERLNGLLINGESRVIIPVPHAVAERKGQGRVLILPGQGCYGFCGDFQHDLAALCNGLALFFNHADAYGYTNGQHQYYEQYYKTVFALHFSSLLLLTTTAIPMPRNASGNIPIIMTLRRDDTLSLMVR